MIAIIAGGTFGGRYLDNKYELDTPYFTIFLSILAVFTALYLVLKEALSDN